MTATRESDMKKIIIIGAKLTLFCAVSALLLGLVNAVTEPVIRERKQQEFVSTISVVSGGGTVGEQKNVEGNATVKLYIPISGTDGSVTGYVLQLIGSGYGGDMTMLAGFAADGSVKSVVLMDNAETPGLGKKAESPDYMKRFIGKGAASPVPVLKSQLEAADADAITGATITFVGVSRALAEGASFVKQLGGKA